MRRPILIALLAFGTIAGYASGFHSLRRCHYQQRESFERHVANVCVDAARHADDKSDKSDRFDDWSK